MEDYLKAVEFLTLNDTNRLQKKIVSLKDKQDEISLMKTEQQRDMKVLREQLEPLLALKNTLIQEGILKEKQFTRQDDAKS